MTFCLKFIYFHSRKCIWICRLQKWQPFCINLNVLRPNSGPAFKVNIDNRMNLFLTLVVQPYLIIMLAIIIWYYIECGNGKVGACIITGAHTRHPISHDDIIKWKHFPCCWPFLQGIHQSSVNSPHKSQWRGALMFSLICALTNSWANNDDASDLRCHRAHYDMIVMLSCTGISTMGYPLRLYWNMITML